MLRDSRVPHALRSKAWGFGFSPLRRPRGPACWSRQANSGRIAGSGRVTDQTDYYRLADHPLGV